MASQSTPISDLPRTEQGSNEDIQESMMVNSILQDIENDDEPNDVNQDSLQYSIDTSQIPPKIGNELPSVETIQETAETIFNDFPTADELMLQPPEENNDIDDFLNKKLEEPIPTPIVEEEKSIITLLEERLPIFLIVVVSFFLLSLKPLNQFLIRTVPKLSFEGELSTIGMLIKSLIMGLVYLASSFFL
jgi:hypothetical protein